MWSSKIDWSLLSMDEIQTMLLEAFPNYGDIEISSQKWVFPLVASLSKEPFTERVVLIGDASHTYHPLAGQGINVSFKDADSLTSILCEAINIGYDIGQIETLQLYQRKRIKNHTTMMYFTNSLHYLFQENLDSLRYYRAQSFKTLEIINPLKNLLLKLGMDL